MREKKRHIAFIDGQKPRILIGNRTVEHRHEGCRKVSDAQFKELIQHPETRWKVSCGEAIAKEPSFISRAWPWAISHLGVFALGAAAVHFL
jgi:hypothetical protein